MFVILKGKVKIERVAQDGEEEPNGDGQDNQQAADNVLSGEDELPEAYDRNPELLPRQHNDWRQRFPIAVC